MDLLTLLFEATKIAPWYVWATLAASGVAQIALPLALPGFGPLLRPLIWVVTGFSVIGLYAAHFEADGYSRGYAAGRAAVLEAAARDDLVRQIRECYARNTDVHWLWDSTKPPGPQACLSASGASQ